MIDEVEDAWVFSKITAMAQPAKIVAVCYGHAVNENGRLIEQMLQTHGINAKCFDEDLDEMLKYALSDFKIPAYKSVVCAQR
jgi:hypothetical protein